MTLNWPNLSHIDQGRIDQLVVTLPILLGQSSPMAIGLQGGVARGVADEYSDTDLVFLFHAAEQASNAVRGRYVDRQGGDWGVYHLYLNQVDPAMWNDTQRHVYGYETLPLEDPTGALSRLCRAALLTQLECQQRFAYGVRKTLQRGVQYPGSDGLHWRGFALKDDPWLNRGDLFSANMRLTQAGDLLVGMIYALNGRPRPSPKVAYSIMRTLKWFPAAVSDALKDLAVVRALDRAEYLRRRKVAQFLLKEIVDEATRIGVAAADMGSVYRDRYSKHHDNTD